MSTTGLLDAGLFDPSDTPEPEKQILTGLISQGELVVWIGREKHRKSNLALQAAICIALGRAFLSFPHGTGSPMRAVYIDYESKKASMQKRYDGICKALGLTEVDKTTLGKHLKIILVREMRKRNHRVRRFPVRLKDGDDLAADTWWKQVAREYPADIYIFDPMRTLHAQDENDSNIEILLTRLREVFPESAQVILHHMTKGSASSAEYDGSVQTLATPGRLRAFANGARGSSAINAHVDVVICQERRIESEVETVYFGAFMKDSADVEPFALVESDRESFFWIPSANVPDHLRRSFEVLRGANASFKNETETVSFLMASGVKRATAYRHFKELRDGGFLVACDDGSGALRVAAEPIP